MILGFMQPYFFPYPGYFALIRHSDTWVVFDDAQMIRHGWVHRNRMLHPAAGWTYFMVPTRKHARGTPIHQVDIAGESHWVERILRQLHHYRHAPFYDAVISLLRESLQDPPGRLDQLCLHTLRATCAWLGIPIQPVLHSGLRYDRDAIRGPGDWALAVASALGAHTYINPPGGRGLFDPAAFAAAGVRLEIHTWRGRPYPQLGREFEPDLSILDMMMFLPPEEIRQRLDEVEVEVL